MNDLIKQITAFGVARLAAIIGVSCGVAIALGLIAMRIGSPDMGVLYANIDYAEAQAIIERLDQENIRYELRDGGATVSIMAPRADISRLRVSLAGDGVIVSGGVGYEIFDDNQTLGATSFQQNINRLRAMEGELARTIATISGVRSARVHLVLPERELFSREKNSASASIVIDAPAGLDTQAVRAIVNLTASAAPGLSPSQVTVLDSAGRLLSSGDADDSALQSGAIEERKAAAEAKIRRNVEEIVGRVVGKKNVRVEVAADMDFSRVTESAEIIDPDSQTVLSSSIVEETSNASDPNRSQGVSVANALPGAASVDQTAPPSTSAMQRTEETTNYEISKTVRNAVREEGLVIKRLSVAVAINAASATDTLSPETISRIDTLVKSAIGFNETRGDQVSVIDLPFSAIDDQDTFGAAATPVSSSQDLTRMVEIGALLIVAAGLIFFVIRPMVSPARVPSADIKPLKQTSASTPLALEPADGLDHRIDLAQVEGKVKAASVNKVAEIVKAHTDESANILRGWIREAS